MMFSYHTVQQLALSTSVIRLNSEPSPTVVNQARAIKWPLVCQLTVLHDIIKRFTQLYSGQSSLSDCLQSLRPHLSSLVFSSRNAHVRLWKCNENRTIFTLSGNYSTWLIPALFFVLQWIRFLARGWITWCRKICQSVPFSGHNPSALLYDSPYRLKKVLSHWRQLVVSLCTYHSRDVLIRGFLNKKRCKRLQKNPPQSTGHYIIKS